MRFEWQDRAACSGMDTEAYYPEGTQDARTQAVLMTLCSRCPVFKECRLASIGEEYGMWAGLSQTQRKNIRKETGMTTAAGRGTWNPDMSYEYWLRNAWAALLEAEVTGDLAAAAVKHGFTLRMLNRIWDPSVVDGYMERKYARAV